MELKYLNEFLVLAETENFSRAAILLSTTQPLLSRHIQKLEQELDVELFARTTKTVQLTSAGQRLIPYARRSVNAMEEYFYSSGNSNATSDVRKELRLGQTEHFNHSDIHDTISQAFMKFSAEPLFFKGSLDVCKKKLLEHQLDIVLAYEPHSDSSSDPFSKITYFSDTLTAILPARHPLSKKTELALSELSSEPFILIRSDYTLGSLALECCRLAGFEPNVTHFSKYEDNIIEMVRKRMGVSLLLKEPQISGNVCTVNVRPTIVVDLNVLYLQDNPNPVLPEFLQFIVDAKNQEIQHGNQLY